MRINEIGQSHPVFDLKLVFNYEFFSPPAHNLFEGQMCLNKRYQIECLQLQCCFSVYFEPEYFYISGVFCFFFFLFALSTGPCFSACVFSIAMLWRDHRVFVRCTLGSHNVSTFSICDKISGNDKLTRG